MTGNRVEELEEKVRDLEATVDGLTDELVETKERLRILEEEVDVDDAILEGRPTRSGPESTSDDADAEAEGEGETSADDVNTDEGEGEDDAGSGDDIIVA